VVGEQTELTNEPTVHIVDDDAAERESLVLAVESCGLRVQPYSLARDFLETHDPGLPGCLVADLRMPDMDGLTLQETLCAEGSRLPVIFHAACGSADSISQAFRRGAVDFLEKPASVSVLLQRIQEALDRHAEILRHQQRLAGLTERERKVLEWTMAGHTAKQIANRLELTLRTIQLDRERILTKTNVESLPRLAYLLGRFSTTTAPPPEERPVEP
jgi:FixJ family two-component response regulator